MLFPCPTSHSVSVIMKLAVACLLVLVAMATVEAGPMKKRFLIKEIQNAINSVGDWFTKTYNSAKDSFNRLASGGELDLSLSLASPPTPLSCSPSLFISLSLFLCLCLSLYLSDSLSLSLSLSLSFSLSRSIFISLTLSLSLPPSTNQIAHTLILMIVERLPNCVFNSMKDELFVKKVRTILGSHKNTSVGSTALAGKWC